MFDSVATQYYLRARWYSPVTGRFNRMDPFAGSNQDPQSLHKYLYAHCNPINNIDPRGNFIVGIVLAIAIFAILVSIPGCSKKTGATQQFNMVFDGSTVRVYRGEKEHDELVATFNAISGNPASGWSQRDSGPVPPGWWWIKRDRIQRLDPTWSPAWGIGRIYINPSTSQPPRTYGRRAMYFHGGSLQKADGSPWYTAGCIKVNDADWDTIVKVYLEKSILGYMRIYVDYSGKTRYHE